MTKTFKQHEDSEAWDAQGRVVGFAARRRTDFTLWTEAPVTDAKGSEK